MLDALMPFIGDNPQALEVFNGLQEQATSNVARLQSFETEVNTLKGVNADVVGKRDNLKGLIRDTLGIEEVSKENIMAKLSSMGSPELKTQFDAQLREVKDASGKQINDLNAKIAEYESNIHSLKLQNAISTTDIMGQVQGSKAGEIIQGLLAQDADFNEDGTIRYVGAAGETKLDAQGNNLTLEARINQIKESKEYDFLFLPRHLNGGGAPTTAPTTGTAPAGFSGGAGAKLTRTTMTHEDKVAYRTKYGEEAYNQLPMI